MRNLMLASMFVATTACGSEAPKPVEPETPKTMAAGEYEIVSDVTRLASSDKSTPATKLKLGDKATFRACVAADGTPDVKMFVEDGDTCTATTTYLRSGRLSVQYSCNRAGKGELYPNVDGNYTATAFKAVVSIGSSFPGQGDYTATRTLSATRVGNCPAAAATAPPTAG